MDKRLLPRIEIGKDDIEAGMGTHGRQRASKVLLPTPPF